MRRKPLAVVVCSVALCSCSSTPEKHNSIYSLQSTGIDTLILKHENAGSWPLKLTFSVLYSEKDPKPEPRDNQVEIHYNILTWVSDESKTPASKTASAGSPERAGDGFDPAILEGTQAGRTADLFAVTEPVTVTASGITTTEQGWTYTFPEHRLFTLTASISLLEGDAPPVLRYTFTPKAEGYFSVGYLGAPAYRLDELDEIWQPFIWQEKRFPKKSFMTLAYRCPIPATLITKEGNSMGVVADPSEFPFDPLPTGANSRFGIALRNQAGSAQAMVFAPALGGQGSLMKAGEPFSFTLRPVVTTGDTTDAFEHIARSLYGFRDYRSNSLGTLNQTLENMIDYGISKWSRFVEEAKGCNYSTDAPGAVKNVSSLNPLSLAIVTDNREIFERRAYPYIEYMLSRKKFLFTTDETQRIQSPSFTLEGPCAPVTELAALYRIFDGATPAFFDLALQEYDSTRVRNLNVEVKGKSWENALAMYRASGKQEYLDFAISGADRYIRERVDTQQRDFTNPRNVSHFFWTSVTPKFIPLFELYEATGEQRYLDAARIGARRYTQFTWMCPAIPEGELLVNIGGKAPHYWYLAGKGHPQMEIPEEKAPAWRLSEIGLTPESAPTCTGHRAIFMANHAPWLIRIGYHSGDAFLREVGRSAIVGRYLNFPGYHINTARTTAYEKADYPLREHRELSVNSFHYNHIWPMMSMLLDYLMAEAMARSEGAIDFPTEFIEGYSYMKNKYYGAGRGRFYDRQDAILWMPKGLVDTGHVEVNYIAARGENSLYIALMNESDASVRTRVTVNKNLVSLAEANDGSFEVEIPPKGITPVTLDDVAAEPRFQSAVVGLGKQSAWKKGFLEFDDPSGRALVLNLGVNTQRVYVYLKNSKRDFQRVALEYDAGAGRTTVADDAFPWEFTVPLDVKANQFTFKISGVRPDGRKRNFPEYTLSRDMEDNRGF